MSSRSPEQTPSWVTVAILAQGTSRAVAVTQAFLAKCCGAGSHHSASSSRGKQGRPQETKEKPRRDLKHVARAMRPNLGCSDNRFHKQGLSKAHQCQRLCPYGWSDKPYRRVATDVWPHVSIFLLRLLQRRSGPHLNTRCVIFVRSDGSGPPWREAAGTAGPPTWVPHMEAGDEFLGTFRLLDKGLRERCCMCGSDRDELCVSLGGRGNADRVRSHLLLL